jgi:hypothetical protein
MDEVGVQTRSMSESCDVLHIKKNLRKERASSSKSNTRNKLKLDVCNQVKCPDYQWMEEVFISF